MNFYYFTVIYFYAPCVMYKHRYEYKDALLIKTILSNCMRDLIDTVNQEMNQSTFLLSTLDCPK